MEFEFVDRSDERSQLRRTIQITQSRPRVIVVDSPAGMGKSRLILEVCGDLVRGNAGRRVEWRIVRIDFREEFPFLCANEQEVIEEIARQLFRDTRWSSIVGLLQDATMEDLFLIQQAAFVPMEDEVRQALLELVVGLDPQVMLTIKDSLAEAFASSDIVQARRAGLLRSVDGLKDFILARCYPEEQRTIPQHVLVVLDGVDAIEESRMRRWVINDLALYLGTHTGLQTAFERLAVIVSGRFVEPDLDPVRRRRSFQEMVLRSFTDKPEYVEDLICQFDDPSFCGQKNLVERLARKLCHACGGHPRVIKDVAVRLHAGQGHFSGIEMDPEGVGYWYDDDRCRGTLRECRDTAIAELLMDVAEGEQELLRLLSVFRKFTPATLEFLSRKIREHEITEYYACFGKFEADIRELYNRLKQTRLIGNDQAKGPFDSDRFALSLLSAYLHDQKPKLFGMLNEWAVELFANWIKGKFSEEADAPLRPNHAFQRVGVCEWLFHRLHLAECCSRYTDADQLGQEISAELTVLLKEILAYPDESQADQWRRIGEDVEEDEQIGHLMWEIALEDDNRRNAIRQKILGAFA